MSNSISSRRNNHILCLVKGCPPPVIITPSQKSNPALFSGSLNNPSSLSTNFSIYSRLSNKQGKPSDWVTKKYKVTPRFIEPLTNNLTV